MLFVHNSTAQTCKRTSKIERIYNCIDDMKRRKFCGKPNDVILFSSHKSNFQNCSTLDLIRPKMEIQKNKLWIFTWISARRSFKRVSLLSIIGCSRSLHTLSQTAQAPSSIWFALTLRDSSGVCCLSGVSYLGDLWYISIECFFSLSINDWRFGNLLGNIFNSKSKIENQFHLEQWIKKNSLGMLNFSKFIA